MFIEEECIPSVTRPWKCYFVSARSDWLNPDVSVWTFGKLFFFSAYNFIGMSGLLSCTLAVWWARLPSDLECDLPPESPGWPGRRPHALLPFQGDWRARTFDQLPGGWGDGLGFIRLGGCDKNKWSNLCCAGWATAAPSRMTHSLADSLSALGHSWHSDRLVGPNCLDAPLAAFACCHCRCRCPGGLIGGAQCPLYIPVGGWEPAKRRMNASRGFLTFPQPVPVAWPGCWVPGREGRGAKEGIGCRLSSWRSYDLHLLPAAINQTGWLSNVAAT